MDRRKFAKNALIASAGFVAAKTMVAQDAAAPAAKVDAPFKLNFAPNYGQFKESTKGYSVTDKLKFFYDKGFRAIEDNGMPNRPVEEQIAMGKEMQRLGIEMGVFVGLGMETVKNNPMWTGYRTDVAKKTQDKEAVREIFKKKLLDSLEVAKRVNAKWCTVVPGVEDPSLEPEYQFANVVDNLRFCAEICEKAKLIMVLEPLNIKNHPAYYLKRIPQAYAICKAVNSPYCKILDDLYHQQVTEGNLIQNMDTAWDEIAYFQIGDVPGRKEPLTGEINFKNVFKHIHEKGYKGVYGMEHGQSDTSAAGDAKLLAAYRAVDLD